MSAGVDEAGLLQHLLSLDDLLDRSVEASRDLPALGDRVARRSAEGGRPVGGWAEVGDGARQRELLLADLEKALPAAVSSVLGNAGQDCCARSRLLLEKSIYDQFISELTNLFKKVRLGDPQNEDTEMGSLISQEQHERVLNYIELGKNEGASLVCGGEPPGEEEFKKGFFLNPTLFTDVKPEMRIAREEIFGPVLCAIPFDTEEEAIAIANKSTYGLSGSIWTQDIERALRVARAIEAGVISINTGHSVHLEAPFGGVKQSGVGRELGLAALEHYSELKSVFIHTGC